MLRSTMHLPDKRGYFGEFGGKFLPETLVPALRELEIEEHPFQLRYAEHMTSCFDLPNTRMQDWFIKIR